MSHAMPAFINFLNVHVHMRRGGRGRSGSVGACLLQSVYGVSVEESLARVKRSFETRGEPPRS